MPRSIRVESTGRDEMFRDYLLVISGHCTGELLEFNFSKALMKILF